MGISSVSWLLYTLPPWIQHHGRWHFTTMNSAPWTMTLYHHEFSTMDDDTINVLPLVQSPIYIYKLINDMLDRMLKDRKLCLLFQLFHDRDLSNHCKTNWIYHHIAERTRKSHPSVQDFQSTTRLVVSWMQQILDTMGHLLPPSI